MQSPNGAGDLSPRAFSAQGAAAFSQTHTGKICASIFEAPGSDVKPGNLDVGQQSAGVCRLCISVAEIFQLARIDKRLNRYPVGVRRMDLLAGRRVAAVFGCENSC
ncbi:hypothetical protein ACK6D9_07825 [Hoeflea sp. Naph1]|uniref:hypothetical protein n=1 Tax=Hoeflea sp. Naph1 TaxID=3388653 RepID=UPI00398FE8D9